MFGFGKKKKPELTDGNSATPETQSTPTPAEPQGLFARLKRGLTKTGNTLTEGMSTLVLGKKKIDEEVLEER